LGRGAYGTVFLVKPASQEDCLLVIKKINYLQNSAGKQLQVLEEVQNLRKLGKHPHVIKYHGGFLELPYLCIVMEYAQKGDLLQYIC
jgi:serine/threonine protein kinase